MNWGGVYIILENLSQKNYFLHIFSNHILNKNHESVNIYIGKFSNKAIEKRLTLKFSITFKPHYRNSEVCKENNNCNIGNLASTFNSCVRMAAILILLLLYTYPWLNIPVEGLEIKVNKQGMSCAKLRLYSMIVSSQNCKMNCTEKKIDKVKLSCAKFGLSPLLGPLQESLCMIKL